MTIGRRDFLKTSAVVAAGAAVFSIAGNTVAQEDKSVRIGIIGTGGRGCSLLGILLSMRGVAVPALCDIDPENLARAKDQVVKAGQPEPECYKDGVDAYKSLIERTDLDAVIIATPWNYHAPMAVDAMKAGKYVGVEVPAALSIEECWALVDTCEQTKMPCMMLENWSFRRDNLAVLNMIRAGLLGDIVHCHCAHSHNCVDYWYFDVNDGSPRWGGEFLARYNRDQYPTHSLGPVISWMDINCGDQFDTITSMATESRAINHWFARKFGPDHPTAKRKFAQGDIVTSTIRTKKGRTIVINNDMQLPRPYDNRWMIQGLDGVYDEDQHGVYIHAKSPKLDTWEEFGPYQEKHEHSWWKQGKDAGEALHGGTDGIELDKFVTAVRNKTGLPIDIYDSISMSCVVALSGMSIAAGSAPVKCPDFTRGQWETRKPYYALEA